MRALIRSTDWRIRPGALTRYFGGQAETAELEGLLDQVRIVTLTGAPGCGKTRLAVEFAALVEAASATASSSSSWPRSPIPRPSRARSRPRWGTGRIGPGDRGNDRRGPRARRAAHRPRQLRARGRCLAPIVLQLTAAAPAVRVLATSRVPLGLSGEQIWTVPPLDTTWAVELFNDRAGLVAGRVTAAADRDAGSRRSCRRLDGLPLAIELVAAFTACCPSTRSSPGSTTRSHC